MSTNNQRTAPANQRSVRRHNLGVVLRHIADRGARSRAALAQETGLNKTTVSSLVGELIEFGLVRETEVELRGTVGRPALPVELSGTGVVGLGLEIGVDFLAVRAADLGGAERHAALVAGDNRGRPVDAVLDDLAGARRRGARRRSRTRSCSPPAPSSRCRAWSTARAACWSRRTSAGPT